MISLTSAATAGTRAAHAYAEARTHAAPAPGATTMTSAAQDFSRLMEQAYAAAVGAMRGTGDTQTLVQSIAEAQIALETAVAIRDKVVEAYQDILRMPV
ncbi:MAG TPA: flagellar hook-basal body complex protein FliE [Paracoccus sp. (in: a-proteobacteria)]|nr:flagellar hook-basal body complex protein FliE [Paracoccus sp. (in: a-proteobacteria)]